MSNVEVVRLKNGEYVEEFCINLACDETENE